MDIDTRKIAKGVTLLSVKTSQFKTNEISINIALPLKKETASVNALLIHLLSRKNKEYSSMSALNKRLAYLYGANLTASVLKQGECQVLKIGVTCLDEKFSLDSSSISFDCLKLITSLIFLPHLDENGDFYDEDINAEKRILIEKIESEQNEKGIYILRQTEALMFRNEPYGINKYGSIDDIKAVTKKDVLKAWHNMLDSAEIMITIVGNADVEESASYLVSMFRTVNRHFKPLDDAVFIPYCDAVKEKMQRIDVNQGKLVLGFRVNLKSDDDLTAAMTTFCDIFGGAPYSKLFANVREKMSLCYYCSARYTRLKSYIMVQCGCDEENMDKAVNEILHQLEEIKNGNFDDEFKSSKIGLRDAILSVNDAPQLIEMWYASQFTCNKIKTPETAVKENDAVTKQQVAHCAGLLTLDTVYKIASPKEDE